MYNTEKKITEAEINQIMIDLISIEVTDIWTDDTCDDTQAKMILGKIEGIIDTGEKVKALLED